jgi:hypothetical protein
VQVQRIDEVVDLRRENQNTSSQSTFKTERERAASASLVYGFFPILPGCRRDPMRKRESVWRQSFPPFPQIQLHIPCPPSSIFVPRSWAAQGRWGPDAVSGSIIRAEGDLVSMIYSCGRLHVPCHSTQLQSDVSTFTGWIWNSAYYWRWIINLCLLLLISVVKVPTNFLPKFFLETKRGLISQLSQSNILQLDVMEITGLFFLAQEHVTLHVLLL